MTANEGGADEASIPVSGRTPGEGNGNPLQYSCLKTPMDRGTWLAQSMGLQRVRHDRAHTNSAHMNLQHAVGAGASGQLTQSVRLWSSAQEDFTERE